MPAGQFLAELSKAVALIGERLEEIARDLQRLADQIADATADALGDLDTLLDSLSGAGGRARFVNQLSSAVSGTAIAVLEDDWAYKHLVPPAIRRDIRDKVRDIVVDLLEGAPFGEFLNAIGVLRDQAADIVDDARGLDRSRPLTPQVADLIIGRFAGLVADRYGTIRIRLAFSFHWNTPLGRIDQDFDLGHVRVNVADVVNIIRPMVNELGAFESAVAALAGRIRQILDAEGQATALGSEEASITQEHARLTEILADQQAGQKSVVIERPTQMQTVTSDVAIRVRLEGVGRGILHVDQHTPQRLFIMVNAQPIELGSFDADDGTPSSRPSLAGDLLPGAARSMVSATAVQQRSNKAVSKGISRQPDIRSSVSGRATIGSQVVTRPAAALNPAGGRSLVLQGHVPADLLVEGLNTLMVTVVTGPGKHISDSVSFQLSGVPAQRDPAAPSKPPRGRNGIPKAVVPVSGKKITLASGRKQAAEQIKQHLEPNKPIRPLGRSATHSPTLADRAGIRDAVPAPLPGRLRAVPEAPKVKR